MFVSKPVADDFQRPWFNPLCLLPYCTARALGTGSHSISSSRSLLEVSAHYRNENEKIFIFGQPFPEANIEVEISMDKALLVND